MKYLKLAPVFLAATIGSMSSAIAGVAGAITTTVEALSGTVTYRTTGTEALKTTVGYKVTVSNVGGNTVNNVVFTGSTKVLQVSDSAGIALETPVENPNEKAYFVEANDDGSACGKPDGTSTAVTCNLGQLRAAGSAGSSRTFAVFFTGPVKNNTCFVSGGPSCEAVTFAGVTDYSEGTSDTSAVNDQFAWTALNVPLGTANPTNVKSALAKSGGAFFTGTDAVPSTLTFPFAARLNAPNPPVFSSVTLDLKKLMADNNNTEVQLCLNSGNFNNCYEAGVIVPNVEYIVGGTVYLTITLRIDSTEVKSPFKKQNVKVINLRNGIEENVQPCQINGLPELGLDRCVFSISRYSNSGTNGELRGDVEVVIRAYSNAPYRIR